MSIQRYNCGAFLGPEDDPMTSLEENSGGEVVLYTDHLTDKQAALDAQQAAHAAEVERLTAERDAAVRERDAAVEALRHCRAEIAYFQRLAHGKQEFPPTNGMVMADAVIAEIEGGRG